MLSFATTMSILSDKRYGVLAPDLDHYDDAATDQNKLVEVKTGRVLAVIQAETGMVHMNHGGILPSRWSADGSLLLWKVDGKWCPRALVLLKIDNGEVKWQRNLLKTAQQEILARTRKASPKRYAAAKKQNAGNGSAYPDGFTVNVTDSDQGDAPLSLPLAISTALLRRWNPIPKRSRISRRKRNSILKWMRLSILMESSSSKISISNEEMGLRLNFDSKPTGLYRFHLPLIADFWGRILLRRQIR